MFYKFIDEFIPVPSLREYLKNEPISDSEVADIIFYAKAPLQRKREALFELEKMEISGNGKVLREYWLKYRGSIDEAFLLMNSENVVFVVYEYSLHEHDGESDEWMHGIFSSYDVAMRFIRKDSEFKKAEKNLNHWYVINLWMKEDEGYYKDTCDYYIIDDELCYAEFDVSSDYYESCVDGELSIPVHYKPGDILIADNYPFEHKQKFVMLEIGDNRDCCCLQALIRRQDGSWKVGAVKHGMMDDTIYPRISVLYTADTYIPDLSITEDAILEKISEIVSGDEKKGCDLWNKLNDSDISSDEKILDILKELGLFSV